MTNEKRSSRQGSAGNLVKTTKEKNQRKQHSSCASNSTDRAVHPTSHRLTESSRTGYLGHLSKEWKHEWSEQSGCQATARQRVPVARSSDRGGEAGTLERRSFQTEQVSVCCEVPVARSSDRSGETGEHRN